MNCGMHGRAAEQTCLALLRRCTSFIKLTQIHGAILKFGLHNNALILTKFISVSSHLTAIDYACSFVFSPESSPHCHDTFLFNTVIKAYAESNRFKRTALRYYNEMLSHGVEPNNYTYPFIFKACAGIGALRLGKMVHASVLYRGFHWDAHVLNSMIHMYCSCEKGIEFGEKVFDEMPETNPVSWSIMIGGYVRWGMPSEAIRLFRCMLEGQGEKPIETTVVLVLSACADLGALELGRWVESYIEREEFEMRPELYNALIDMFAKCGDVDKALGLFRNMPESKRTIVSWTSAIFGVALHGHGLEAISLFEEMKRAGVVLDDVAFIGLLSACSHSGLVEEGRQYFQSMVKDYGVAPRIEHYGCMVDLLCRAGLVKEAMEFIDKMPMAPNPVILRTLIAACRTQGQLNLGERVSKELILNDPMQESNYVLLSDIYAKSMDWEKKIKVRETLVKKGIRKVPGSTMIEPGSDFYEFVAGDKSHRKYPEICENGRCDGEDESVIKQI